MLLIEKFPVKFRSKKALALIIPLALILCCCCSCLFIYIFGSLLPPQLKITSRNTNSWSAEAPTEILKFQCTAAYKVYLNDKLLTTSDVDDLCKLGGYKVDLKDGDNTFVFRAENNNGNSTNLQLNIKFDLNAYNLKQQQEAEKQKQAELDRQKAEADAKAKEEADAKAKAEAETKAVQDWKSKYQKVKDEKINVAVSTSESVINSYSSGSNMYQIRSLAQQAKDYFTNCAVSSQLDKDLSPIPVSLVGDVNQLKSSFSDFCFANEHLADDVIRYAEADTTSKQYSALDDIKTHSQEVANAKYNLQLTMSILETVFN